MKKWLLILFLLLSLNAFGQASVSISPVAKQQFLDANGKPLVSGKLYTYQAGTTNPQATYRDATGTAVNTNPIILDAGGWTPNALFLITGDFYQFVLYTSGNVLVWSVDNFSSATGGGSGDCPGSVLDTSVLFVHPLGTCDGVTKFKTNESGQVDINSGGTFQVESVLDPTNNYYFNQGHQGFITSNSANYDGSTNDGFTAYVSDLAAPPDSAGAIIGTSVEVSSSTLTIAASTASDLFPVPGHYAYFSGCVGATFLNGQTIQITNATNSQLVAVGTSFGDYTNTADNCTIKSQESSNPNIFYGDVTVGLGGAGIVFNADRENPDNFKATSLTSYNVSSQEDSAESDWAFKAGSRFGASLESVGFIAESDGSYNHAHNYLFKAGNSNSTPYWWVDSQGRSYTRIGYDSILSTSLGSCTASTGLSDCTPALESSSVGSGPPKSETIILKVCSTGADYDTIDWIREASTGDEPSCDSSHMFAASTSPTVLMDQITVTFGAATGHTQDALFTLPVTVTYGTQLNTLGGNYFASTALPKPAAPVLTASTGGATTWQYEVVMKWNGVPTEHSDATPVTTVDTLTGSDTISIYINNALNYDPAITCDIYRTVAGTSPSTTGLIASNQGCTSTYVDTGAAGDSSTAPTVNLTGHTILGDGYLVTPPGTPLTFPGIIGTGCIGITNGVVDTSVSGCSASGGATLQVNGSDNSSQTVLDVINSTVNAVGLSLTASNPSGGQVKYEITGNSYTGNAATATAATSATSATTAGALSGTPTQCTGTDFATGILANGDATGCATPGAGGSAPTLKTNTVNITTQTALDLTNSSTNAVGLTATFSNPSGSVVKAEITGSSYTGNAATATALASYTGYSVYGSSASAGAFITPTGNSQCLMSAPSSYATTTPSFQSCASTSLFASYQFAANTPITSVGNYFQLLPGVGLTSSYTGTGASGDPYLATLTLAVPSATTLGGVESFAAVTHQWIRQISTSGVPTASQPASTDLSDYGSIPNAALQNASVTFNGTTVALGASGSIPLQTNTVNNTSMVGLNNITSTTNAVGLTVTPTNSGTNQVKYEVTGASYTGTAAKATQLASTPTSCAGMQYAYGIAVNGNANCAGINNTTLTVGVTTVGANSCNTGTPITMTNVASTSTFTITPTSDISAVTGWGAGGGVLFFVAWPTANTLNFKVCNNTSSAITPGGSTTWNVSAR